MFQLYATAQAPSLLVTQIAYPPGIRFNTPDEQRKYVVDWLIRDANLPLAAQNLDITFYAARSAHPLAYVGLLPIVLVTASCLIRLCTQLPRRVPQHLPHGRHHRADPRRGRRHLRARGAGAPQLVRSRGISA